ncbi:3-phosphoshikimate 1-carboxyvinyltransferase [candidate division WOR-3 bacterium]|nr:3-phosphoshikimate 1-carboxyvinyltransferase [candidate division WOR-3 bacterium]
MKLILSKASKIRGEIKVSGDKSITHRGLIVGSIAEGITILKDYSTCDDCMATMEIMKKLGTNILKNKATIRIEGKGLHGLKEPDDILDCKNSGTSMRLLSGLLSGQNFFSVLTGDSSLLKRPMKRIIEPLRLMGAKISGRENDQYAPLTIKGGNLKAIDYKLKVASAQVKSAILLASLYVEGNTSVTEPSQSRDHTERILNLYGAKIESSKDKITLKDKNKLKGKEISIPGDISSAAFFLVLASIIKGSRLLIKNVGINPTRTGILEVLKTMGADISIKIERNKNYEPVADLIVKASKLKSIKIFGEVIPKVIDELPILAVAATQAEGVTEIKDAHELRVKETDRIYAIAAGLKKMGAKIEEKPDGLIIEGPSTLKGNICESFNDHRIGMALAIAGVLAEGKTQLLESECIDVSFPEFTSILRRLCGADHVYETN